MLHIAICGDEEYFRTREKELVTNYMDHKGYKCRIDIFSSGRELLKPKKIIAKYDIIFLDINMHEIDGLQTAKEIRRISKDVYLVFVTAFAAFALEGYKVDAVRCLLKDDECLEEAFCECLEAIMYKMHFAQNKYTFEFQEGKVVILFEDILYVESRLHKLTFHMAGEAGVKYTMYARLDDMDELLRNVGFCRIHKSYLVNLKYVESVERYKAQLSNGVSLGISKARYIDTRNELSSYISNSAK